MKRYSVVIPWHCSVIVKCEAENEEQAKEIALQKTFPTLCYCCSEEIELGEANLDYDPDVQEI
jgi:hypothetical protein